MRWLVVYDSDMSMTLWHEYECHEYDMSMSMTMSRAYDMSLSVAMSYDSISMPCVLLLIVW